MVRREKNMKLLTSMSNIRLASCHQNNIMHHKLVMLELDFYNHAYSNFKMINKKFQK